ncbi:MAG: hypothetical protein QXQ94_09665 [Candidatus Bathyarchaeia archaeon]
MDILEKAKSVVARLTEEYRIKLRQLIDECLSAATNFDETGKPEYFVKMKGSMRSLWKRWSGWRRKPRKGGLFYPCFSPKRHGNGFYIFFCSSVK